MRRRLYFVLPNVQSAQSIERELLLAKLDNHHFHFLAKDGINLGNLSVATLFQRTDLIHGLQLGLVAGGLTGILAGIALYFYPDFGAQVGLGAVLLLAVFGAIVGAWASGMIAVSIPNSRLASFQWAIDSGKILLMVDVPVRRVKEIRELIRRHHPEVEPKGQDAQVPVFP